MISFFLSNTSAKNYRNRIVYVKMKISRMQVGGTFFETRCIILFYREGFASAQKPTASSNRRRNGIRQVRNHAPFRDVLSSWTIGLATFEVSISAGYEDCES